MFLFFFFFKQKTAYEFRLSLVGSDMCIRGRFHEFANGTEEAQNVHEQEMNVMLREGMMTTRVLRHDRMLASGMMHVDENARLLAPDETAELIWIFSGEQDELIIACNVPGHRAAGMEGVVTIGADHPS